RGNSTKNGRIPPTLVSKIQAHTREFELICSILPVSEIVYEKSEFDMHAIVNPEVLTNNIRKDLNTVMRTPKLLFCIGIITLINAAGGKVRTRNCKSIILCFAVRKKKTLQII
ncbi:MAG: RRXRR domain-containing protein, partial [Deltaproteobacteria bacterium]|nr:RRXRR domain-containing protein [Deltaproteobacteria bacterium]